MTTKKPWSQGISITYSRRSEPALTATQVPATETTTRHPERECGIPVDRSVYGNDAVVFSWAGANPVTVSSEALTS
jgi:hypothetical protein